MALTDNLRAYWKTDESSGNAIDSSGNGYTLTNVNSVAYSTGKINNGADFGSSDANKNLSTDSNLGISTYDADFSVSLWVKLNTEITSGSYMFIEKILGPSTNVLGYTIRYEYNSGTIRLRIARERHGVIGYYNYYTVTLGTTGWHHIVLTYDNDLNGGTMKGYLDNTEITSQTSCAGNGKNDATLITKTCIGAGWNGYSTGTSDNALAIIDEIGVWNKPLSTTEISSLYNSGYGLQYPFTGFTVSVTDAINITESVTIEFLADGYSVNVNDSISISEDIVNLLNLEIVISEDISITENVLEDLTISDINAIENVSITEDVINLLNLENLIIDDILITENSVIENLNLGDIDVIDSITITENETDFSELYDIVEIDNISIFENVITEISILEISIIENVSISENINIFCQDLEILNIDDISIVENISITEDESPIELHVIDVFDNIIIIENTENFWTLDVLIIETISISENFSILKYKTIYHKKDDIYSIKSDIFTKKNNVYTSKK